MGATRAERLTSRRTRLGRRRRRYALTAIVVLIVATCSAVAFGAVSQVTELTVCVAADGSTSRFNPYEGDCPGTDQEVAWSVRGVTPPSTQPTTTTSPTTTTRPTTTTAPVTTTTVGGPVGNTKPAAGGYFQVLPPNAALPSDAQCAARIHRSTWEPRSDNTTANHTTATHLPLGYFGQWSAAWNTNYKPRITGSFFGTTDEIFQFYACRWGWSDELIRAEAVSESNWHQSQIGDANTSFGVMQVRDLYHPRVACATCAGSSWPDSQRSTPFNVDLFGAEMRGCTNNMSSYFGPSSGNVAGCIQSWFSGSWTPGGGSYYQGVLGHYNAKPWLGW